MVIVSLLGMDPYLAIEKTRDIQKELCNLYGLDEEDLEVFAPQSFIIHSGMEQTSFRLNVEIQAPYELEDKEEEVAAYLKEALKSVAIHIRILFNYFDPDKEYFFKDEVYPLHMNDDNVVHAEVAHDHYDEYETEPYQNEILDRFDQYMYEHPDLPDDEIQNVIDQIREEVMQEHEED